jgi:hypothetical protein
MNLNTDFVFESKTKTTLIAGMVLGAVCLGLTFFGDDEFHTRFWSNFLQNSVYFTGIAFTATFFLCAQITAFAGWNVVVKRVWEAMGMFMLVGLVLMGILAAGVWGHFHHLYHWNTPGITEVGNPLYDKILAGKKAFLNPTFYTVGVMLFLGIWYYWATNLRRVSMEQDASETVDFSYYKKSRKWAASFLPLGGFLSTVFIWQSVMSVDPHWYSTMFAWYGMISMLLGAISMTIMLIIYLKSKGYMEYVTREHLHDIGKFLFGISVFWSYLWFDQFMLIWYSNNGEETIYFKERMDHYPVLFWGNLLLNFVTPFLILMRNDTKRKFGTLFFVSAIVFFGHWWDFFYMVKPGTRIAAHEAKEIKEGKHGKHHDAVAPISSAAHSAVAKVEEHTAEVKKELQSSLEHATTSTEHKVETAIGESHDGTKHAAADHATPTKEAHETEVHAAKTTTETHASTTDSHTGGHGTAVDESKAFKLGYTIPGLEELGILVGFLSLFLFVFFSNLSKASLLPSKDPYLDESFHHETGAMPAGEEVVAHH